VWVWVWVCVCVCVCVCVSGRERTTSMSDARIMLFHALITEHLLQTTHISWAVTFVNHDWIPNTYCKQHTQAERRPLSIMTKYEHLLQTTHTHTSWAGTFVHHDWIPNTYCKQHTQAELWPLSIMHDTTFAHLPQLLRNGTCAWCTWRTKLLEWCASAKCLTLWWTTQTPTLLWVGIVLVCSFFIEGTTHAHGWCDIVVDYPDSHPAVSMNYYGVAVYIKKAHTQTHTHTHVSRVLLS